nr:CcdB family protein [Sphingopyxis sp. PET50]
MPVSSFRWFHHKPRRNCRACTPFSKSTAQQHVLATQLASAVDSKELGARVTSLADQRYDILNALDMLVTGV